MRQSSSHSSSGLGVKPSVAGHANPSEDNIVQQLLDLEKIKRLKHRYWRAIDRHLDDEIGDVFATDATCEYLNYGTIMGRTAIVEFFRTSVYPTYEMMVHHGSNAEIDFTGNGAATGRWSYEAWMLAREPRVGFWHAGFYDDLYVVEDGEWRIRHTIGHHDFNVRVEDGWASERFTAWPPPVPGQM